MTSDWKNSKATTPKNKDINDVQAYLENHGPKTFAKIEEVYEYIGPVGRSQICYSVVLSYLYLVAAFNFLVPVFLLVVPEWKCKAEKICTEDLCTMPRENWDWTNKDRTMTSYFELQCDTSYAILSSSLFFVPGTVVGLAGSGYLSDKYGRKKVMLLSILASLFTAIGQTFSSSYPLFLVFRTLSGVTSVVYMSVHITYRDEFFPSTKRPLCHFLSALFKTAGLLVLAGVYEGFTSWRALNGASSILLVVSLLCVFVPESPHWLLTNSSPEAAAQVLVKMARFNLGSNHGCEDHIKLVATRPAKAASSGNVLTIVRNRELLIATLKLCYQWFVTSLLFYGFFFSLDALSGSVSVNFMIMGVLELPMAVATAAMTDKIGRKITLFANVLLVMVCCSLSLLKVNFGNNWTLKRISSIVGAKWGASAMFMIVYLYTNEVMPTSLRSTGVHMCSICARIGAFIAPYFVKACNNANDYLLNSIFVVLCGLALLLTWGLPETKDKSLQGHLEIEKPTATAKDDEL